MAVGGMNSTMWTLKLNNDNLADSHVEYVSRSRAMH